MAVSTRKRASAAADEQPAAAQATHKRARTSRGSPKRAAAAPSPPQQAASPPAAAPAARAPVVKKGEPPRCCCSFACSPPPPPCCRLLPPVGRPVRCPCTALPPPSLPRAGSRGAAYLACAGVAAPLAQDAPAAAEAPRLSTKKESAVKAARRAADEADAPPSVLRSEPRRNPLLRQELPAKLNVLLDIFGERAGAQR